MALFTYPDLVSETRYGSKIGTGYTKPTHPPQVAILYWEGRGNQDGSGHEANLALGFVLTMWSKRRLHHTEVRVWFGFGYIIITI